MSNSEELESSATGAVPSRNVMSTQSTSILHAQLTSRKLKGLENYNNGKMQ